MEQFELNFLTPEKKDDTLDSLSDIELQTRYEVAVGVNPLYRGLGRSELIAGIQNPEAEKERLSALDAAEDKEDLKKPYAR